MYEVAKRGGWNQELQDYEWTPISVVEALVTRSRGDKFRCLACKNPVAHHKASGEGAHISPAHAQHRGVLKGEAKHRCTLSCYKPLSGEGVNGSV